MFPNTQVENFSVLSESDPCSHPQRRDGRIQVLDGAFVGYAYVSILYHLVLDRRLSKKQKKKQLWMSVINIFLNKMFHRNFIEIIFLNLHVFKSTQISIRTICLAKSPKACDEDISTVWTILVILQVNYNYYK